jgi:hypothetical protein
VTVVCIGGTRIEILSCSECRLRSACQSLSLKDLYETEVSHVNLRVEHSLLSMLGHRLYLLLTLLSSLLPEALGNIDKNLRIYRSHYHYTLKGIEGACSMLSTYSVDLADGRDRAAPWR